MYAGISREKRNGNIGLWHRGTEKWKIKVMRENNKKTWNKSYKQ